jgi:hypothetical protein
MSRRFSLVGLILIGLVSITLSMTPQMVRNPKLSQPDLAAAKTATAEAGGTGAELVYAVRLDAAQRGTYDSLLVVYAKPARRGKDHFAFVLREGKRLPLAYDKEGRALKSGDKFLRTGLKHEEGKAPLLRLMGGVTEAGKGEQQRNIDFQFNGSDFVLLGDSLVSIAK